MTEEEICRNYLQAANPAVQVGILADLNVTSKEAIKLILEECGIAVNLRKAKGRTSRIWTEAREKSLVHLLSQGLTQKEIAAKLGVSRSAVSIKISKEKSPTVARTTAELG